MEAVLYSHARNNLRTLIDRVCDDMDEYLITTKDDKTAILLSYDEYRSMKETLYLMETKANKRRLDEAIEQIETGYYTFLELA